MPRAHRNPALAAVLRYIEAQTEGGSATETTPAATANTPSTGTTAAPEPQDEPTPTDQSPGHDADDEPLGDAGKKALQAERDAKKTAEQNARDASAALAAERQAHDAAKERLTALEAELATMKDQAATATSIQRQLDVLTALYEHQVPAEHRHLVKGDTAEELMAAAESISALARRPGVVPLSGTTGATAPTTSSVDAGRQLFHDRRKPTTSRKD